jgi:hypothetical protein
LAWAPSPGRPPPFGGSGRVPKAPEVGVPESSFAPATGMYAAKGAAYDPLNKIYFDSSAVRTGLNRGHAAISLERDPQGVGANLNIPPDVQQIVTNLNNGQWSP